MNIPRNFGGKRVECHDVCVWTARHFVAIASVCVVCWWRLFTHQFYFNINGIDFVSVNIETRKKSSGGKKTERRAQRNRLENQQQQRKWTLTSGPMLSSSIKIIFKGQQNKILEWSSLLVFHYLDDALIFIIVRQEDNESLLIPLCRLFFLSLCQVGLPPISPAKWFLIIWMRAWTKDNNEIGRGKE